MSRRETVPKSILHDRLEQQARNGEGLETRLHIELKIELPAESLAHHLGVSAHPLELPPQWNVSMAVRVVGRAQQVAEVADHAIRRIHVFPHAVRDRVERVEQEMRLD